MPQQVLTSVENNFTKGLITEATGLNFPENAATAASNCIFTLIGDVTRRQGINFELNGTTQNINRTLSGMSTYVWNNPGGDGNSKLLVKQVGGNLYFYNIATATVASPLSTQSVGGTISVSAFTAAGGTFDATKECQYADGNGYLFVYHPSCDPFYLTYNPNALMVQSFAISVQVRDFQGVVDNLNPNIRPATLSNDHAYNLANQGWTTSPAWIAFAQINTGVIPGNMTFQVGAVSGITNGQIITVYAANQGNTSYTYSSATVINYVAGTGTLTINVNSIFISGSNSFLNWTFYPTSTGYISTWFSSEGNYPSNADIWWTFKDSTNTFNPTTTQPQVSLSLGLAPRGHFVLNAFNQDRTSTSSIQNLTTVSTSARPTTGAWFAGRVWYTGVNASFPAFGDANFFTWTENIYFSQIIQTPQDFGSCFQKNDPTNQDFSDLLPTDGGVITIVGSGTIHKLFPIANGMLVFANNGVWFITGSQGIGFTATDYTVTKISAIKCLSATSYVDVLGLPYFWNEEGIYQVTQAQGGQLQVNPLTVGTILTYYNNIPLASKKYARGSYDPINYTLQWCYRSTLETSATDRYQFDTILNYNTYNHAFFPYNINTGSNTQYIHGINYISYPYISNATPLPDFKYHSSQLVSGNYQHGFAEEYDPTFVDWGGTNYTSSFTTGYKLPGGALHRFMVPYVYTFSRNSGYAAFYIQGVWDYAINFDSNKWTMPQFIELNETNVGMIKRRHRMRGRGTVLQLQFTSVPGQPFDLMGWAVYDNVNMGV